MKTLLAALVLIVAAPQFANAACGEWRWRTACRGWPNEDCVRQKYCRYWVQSEPSRVYGYERRERERDEPPRAHCLYEFPPIRATGDDKLDEDKAQVSAQDRWSIEIENRHGTRFSDIRFAARATSACARKVPTSATEKGQAALGIRHWACVYEAVPCSSPKIPVDEDTRAKRSSEKRDDEVGRLNDPKVQYYDAQPAPKRRWWRRENR